MGEQADEVEFKPLDEQCRLRDLGVEQQPDRDDQEREGNDNAHDQGCGMVRPLGLKAGCALAGHQGVSSTPCQCARLPSKWAWVSIRMSVLSMRSVSSRTSDGRCMSARSGALTRPARSSTR